MDFPTLLEGFPALVYQILCPGKLNSLRRPDRESAHLRAMHWNYSAKQRGTPPERLQIVKNSLPNSLPQGISEPILSARIA